MEAELRLEEAKHGVGQQPLGQENKHVCVCVSNSVPKSRGAAAHLPTLPNEATEDAVEGFMDAWTCTC